MLRADSGGGLWCCGAVLPVHAAHCRGRELGRRRPLQRVWQPRGIPASPPARDGGATIVTRHNPSQGGQPSPPRSHWADPSTNDKPAERRDDQSRWGAGLVRETVSNQKRVGAGRKCVCVCVCYEGAECMT